MNIEQQIMIVAIEVSCNDRGLISLRYSDITDVLGCSVQDIRALFPNITQLRQAVYMTAIGWGIPEIIIQDQNLYKRHRHLIDTELSTAAQNLKKS